MKDNRSLGAVVGDLDLETEDIAQLTVERRQVGVGRAWARAWKLRALARAMSDPPPGRTRFASASVWRTDSPLETISRTNASGSGAVAIALACPMLISPRSSDWRTLSGSSSSRSKLATWLRDL